MKKNHILKEKKERKKTPFKLDLTKLIILVFILFIAAALLWNPLQKLTQEDNRERIKEKILSYNELAPIIFIAAITVQTIISIIPGQVGMIIGGYIFGPWLGALYSTIGLVIGSAIVFYLGRRFGRPLLEDLVDPKVLKKFDKKSEEKGIVTLLFIFLLPFTPDNAACLVAGTTNIRMRTFLIIAAIGRLPGTVVANMIGAGIDQDISTKAWFFIGALVILLGLAFYHKKRLEHHTYQMIKPKKK